MSERAALLADVGGMRARFALLPEGADAPIDPVELPGSAFRDLAGAVRRALAEMESAKGGAVSLAEAAVAVAGPVTGDEVELTNVAWRFSIEGTRRTLGLERLEVINDVAAVAHALPGLGEGESRVLQAGAPVATGPQVVLSVGTGLGMAVAAPVGHGGGTLVLSTEGGHRDLAATTEREWRIVEHLSELHGGHVSAERVVSGEGLSTLHWCLSILEQAHPVALSPEEVGERALAGEPRAVEVLELWSGWLGAVAGDAALTCGATGGLWLAGGVLPRLGAAFSEPRFLDRFLAKGRFRSWLDRVPVRLLLAPDAAFRGLARRVRRATR